MTGASVGSARKDRGVPIATDSIFGVPWSEVEIAHVQALLDGSDDEPLLWEAKGTKISASEVRRQVCGFANSHEGGYLILGASRSGTGPWELAGVQFPTEPGTWLTNVVSDPETGVRPRPDFDVKEWPAANGHVAVLRISPISAPPCITNGTLYERLPGETRTVRDPGILADLFRRGDQARNDAQARADRAAAVLMADSLESGHGIFERYDTGMPDLDEERLGATAYIRFTVGVASTGHAPNIASRLFQHDLAVDVWNDLLVRPGAMSGSFAKPSNPVNWSQDALLWRHQSIGPVDSIAVVRAGWDGSVAAGEKVAAEDILPDRIADRLSWYWRTADTLVTRLGGFGDMYLTAFVAGGRFPRRDNPPWVAMRRGPLLPGVDDEHIASVGRELMRVLGNHEPEP